MSGPTVVLVDSDFRDCDIERKIVQDAGLTFLDARSLTETDRLAAMRTAAGWLVQYTPITRPMIEGSTSLRVVVPYGVGTDMIDGDAARDRGVAVTAIPDYCVDEVADHTMALVLAQLRRIVPLSGAVAEGGWPQTDELGDLQTLAGKRFAVIGYGRIGRSVLRRAGAFGVVPAAHDPFVDSDAMHADGVEPMSLAEAFRCDVVSLHLPLNAQTTCVVGPELLALMPEGGVLVNVARGGLVDEPALLAVLAEGRITAALDVLATEPPPQSHILTGHPRVTITPHAAWYSTQALEAVRRRAAVAVVQTLGTELNSTSTDAFQDANSRKALR